MNLLLDNIDKTKGVRAFFPERRLAQPAVYVQVGLMNVEYADRRVGMAYDITSETVNFWMAILIVCVS